MKKFLQGAIIFTCIFFLYLSTVPNINTGFADSDELITVARVHGVAHPPGYPLYTMLSTGAGALPLPFSYAGKINIVSAILQALTAVVIFFICKYLIDTFTDDNEGSLFSSLFATTALTISFSFWFFALFAEVFALNNILIVMTILLLFLWKTIKNNKLLFAAAFTFGLGLGNQQAILLLVPAFFFLFLFINHKILFQWKIILVAIVCLLIGFTLPYLYIPFAASKMPLINWGNAQTFAQIIQTIRRAAYADAQGSGAYVSIKGITMQQRILGFQLFYLYIINNFSWLYTIVGLIGAGFLAFKKKYGLLIFISLGILGGGLFFAVYSPPNISVYSLYELGIHYRFYLASLMFFAIFIAFGVHALYHLANHFTKKYSFVVYALLFFMTLPMFFQNYREIKANDFSIGHNYGKALLTGLERNALLICYSEPSCFTAQYVQLDEHIRQDVVIVPADFVQQTPQQIKKKYPTFLRNSVERKNAKHAVELVKEMVRINFDKRPIYVAGINHDPNYFAQYSFKGNPYYLVPQGCAMKVSKTFTVLKKTDACREVEYQAVHSFFTEKAPISRMIPLYIGYQKYFNYIQYYAAGCIKRAEAEYKIALQLNPIVQFATPKSPDFSKKDTCIL